MSQFILKAYTAFALLLMISINSKAQGSINAFYDAKFFSEINSKSDRGPSQHALNILAAYSGKPDTYSFDTDELRKLYKTIVSNLFVIDSLFSFFEEPYVDKDPETEKLNEHVNTYKQQKNELNKILDKADTLKKLSFRGNIQKFFEIKNSAANPDSISIKDSVLREYSFHASFIQKIERDTAVYETDVNKTLGLLEEHRLVAMAEFGELTKELNAKLSRSQSDITKFYLNNSTKLDIKLQKRIASNTSGKKSASIDLSVPNVLYTSSIAADSFYYKNETYTLTNFKLPSQTEMIDALAIYLAKRFKQEVALTLVDQFRKILKNDKMVNELFPETYKMFSTGKVYEMPSFGSAWNYAISKDFNNLLPNLAKSTYVVNKVGDSLVVKQLQDVVSLCNLINKQYSYVDVVTTLYNQGTKSDLFTKNIAALQIINKELFDTASAARFWVNAEHLYSLNNQQVELFFALIKEKYKKRAAFLENIDVTKTLQLKNRLSSLLVILNNFQATQRKMLQVETIQSNMQLSTYWRFLNQLFEGLNAAGDEKLTAYTQKFINVSNLCFETYELLNQKNYAGAALKIMDLLPDIRDNHYVDIATLVIDAKKINKISNNIEKQVSDTLNVRLELLSNLLKQYLADKKLLQEINATNDFREILTDPRFNKFKSKSRIQNYSISDLRLQLRNEMPSLKNAIDSLARYISGNASFKKYLDRNVLVDSVVNTIATNYQSPQVKQFIIERSSNQFDAFRKLTGFLSDMLVAGNSRNLSQVIEKYAMPPNSYKIKRESRTSWDLNAYVGAYFGAELLDSSSNTKVGGVYGFSAPIGISYSWAKGRRAPGNEVSNLSGRKTKTLKGNSFTLTLSLIDIGAVVSYRLGNTSQGLPREVKWAQLLSPGLHARWGIKSTPLCFSLGIQSTPELRSIKNTTDQASTLRSYAGLFFDLPLYNIAHRN